MIVTGGNSAGDFLRLLGNGKAFGLKHLNYTYQEGEGGIADALSLVEHFAERQPICVVLGDNLIEKNIRGAADEYRKQGKGAKILLKRVHDPQRFGVPELDGERVVAVHVVRNRWPVAAATVTALGVIYLVQAAQLFAR